MDGPIDSPDSELLQAYRTALYRVLEPVEFVIRVGETSLPADSLVHSLSCPAWALITAWNPRSKPLALTENQTRQIRLRLELQKLCLETLPAQGEDPLHQWPAEESLLVLGIDRSTAVELGVRFEQWAIVYGALHQPAELVVCPLPRSSIT